MHCHPTKNLTDSEKKIVLSVLNEDIEIQMMKDLNHHRAKYTANF